MNKQHMKTEMDGSTHLAHLAQMLTLTCASGSRLSRSVYTTQDGGTLTQLHQHCKPMF